MRFLEDERLYWDAEHCLRFLRGLQAQEPNGDSASERYHLYWRGPFSTKQAFAVKSLLATQRSRGEVTLWLDREHGYDGHEQNAILQSLASELTLRPFDPVLESQGTPLEGMPELYEGASAAERSDLFRLVTLHNHGGVYLDLDVMLLRDLAELFRLPLPTEEFCYRWSADLPYANSAVMRLRQGSETAREILARSAEVGSCDPRDVLRFEDAERLDLTVLPCAFFDPLWPHADGKSRLERAPFDGFDAFFRKFGWRFRPGPDSYGEFFPGAFAYHWHNLWDSPEHDRSYFGRFARELDVQVSRELR